MIGGQKNNDVSEFKKLIDTLTKQLTIAGMTREIIEEDNLFCVYKQYIDLP